MKRFFKRFLISLGVIVLLGFVFVAMPVMELAGMFDEESTPHFAGSCQPIEGVVGAEAVAVDDQTGLVFLSSFERRRASEQGLRGRIYVLDPENPSASLRDITPQTPADFRPLGIAFYRDGKGARLFVVNHPQEEAEAVEIYRVGAGQALTHQRTITSPLFNFPNSIMPIDATRFYVTSSFGLPRPLLPLEAVLALPFGKVLFFDGKEAQPVAGGLRFANGVQLSKDGKTLYVAELTGRRIRVYQRDSQTQMLQLQSMIDVGGGPDNLSLDETGDLWVAAPRNFFALVQIAQNPDLKAPARVLRIRSASHDVEEIYYNEGEEVSSVSHAAPIPGGMILGTLYDDHVLLCRFR